MVPGFAAYSASKFALEALADVYRYELSQLGIDSVIVEPGIHRTLILERLIPPADQDRVHDYGFAAEAIERVKGVFDRASPSTETPGPEGVAEAFVRLIETAAGVRPFRTVPTTAVQPLLEPYNTLAVTMRETVAQIFKVPELAVLQPPASLGV